MPNTSVDDVVKRVHSAMDKVEEMASPVNRNSASIRIEAGGIAVWIVTLIAAAIFALYLDNKNDSKEALSELSSQIRELREKDDIHDAWLQTINNNKQDKKK